MSVDDGRYVYCVVRRSEADETDEADEEWLSADGVDGGSPYLVESDGVAAVVQPCSSPFESEDVRQLRRWLLQHQTVVDDAGETFGTPIPFRFDTVVDGGDDAVTSWLAEEGETFQAVLDALAGCWEYRIEAGFDAERLAEDVDDDPELRELAAQREEASAGKAHLLDKKYERRRDGLVADRVDAHRAELTEELEARTEAMQAVDDSDGATFADAAGEETADADVESISLSVLAAREAETEIGDLLESVADETGASVKFTGPWPPYSYAPAYLDAAREGDTADRAAEVGRTEERNRREKGERTEEQVREPGRDDPAHAGAEPHDG